MTTSQTVYGREDRMLSRAFAVRILMGPTGSHRAMSSGLPSPTLLCILVGAPNRALRERLAATLRQQGHDVLEAADAQDMRQRLEAAHKPFDLILCGGLLAEAEDAELAQRIASPSATRALVLVPTGGLLSTATRAQRLGAAAVLPDLSGLDEVWNLLRSAGHSDAEA